MSISPFRPLSLFTTITFLLFITTTLSPTPSLSTPNPDPATIQPLLLTPSLTPPATIPAFPEQSATSTCPLSLPSSLFPSLSSACSTSPLHRLRCCPLLAAFLYSAYSSTSLSPHSLRSSSSSRSYDMPLLPDDSETCVNDLGKELKLKGIKLNNPNETCDVVYCYCGIRLHPLSCPEAFGVNEDGKLEGNHNVKKLERDCVSGSTSDTFPGLGGCTKCLNTLYLLNKNISQSSKLDDNRTTKMHNKDCQIMGLTWLLAKNQSAYIHTVTAVLRALMMSPDGSHPQSCTLNSDGMPLAVDSSEIPNTSSRDILLSSFYLFIASVCFLYVQLYV